MMTLVAVFLVTITISIFFSGCEMAFVSANKLKLREMADTGNRNARFIMKLYRNPQYFLTALLIGNNLTYVASTSILTYLFREYLGIQSEWAIMLIMAPLLIIFTEMVPKDYCRLRAIPFLIEQTFWLKGIQQIFYLPSLVFFKAVDIFWPALTKRSEREIFVNEEEFRSLIEESSRRGIVGPQEEKLIQTILDFERLQVHSVMIPLSKAPKIDIHGKVEDLKRIARETHAKMVLVYEEISSIVVGMVYIFDILWEEENTKGLHDFLRAPIFISESTSIEKAFLTLQEKRQSFAVVTDQSGNVKGFVPIERLLMFDKR
ncbi:MAG TPA: CNNM domain-containing protein [Candidatus Omnitrophota bacterium]|nr:CNNM domain-containing protein [Candidatus Omnitrophota bacterium]